jgi:hypothetical protein
VERVYVQEIIEATVEPFLSSQLSAKAPMYKLFERICIIAATLSCGIIFPLEI